MSINVELKARVEDFDLFRKKLSKFLQSKINQKDTFINCSEGYLKFRLFNKEKAQLIYYKREITNDARPSFYEIFNYRNNEESRMAIKNFRKNYGVKGIVIKQREYYRDGKIRIHLDEVEKLGKFIEIEVEVCKNLPLERAKKLANDYFFNFLRIDKTSIVPKSYIDIQKSI